MYLTTNVFLKKIQLALKNWWIDMTNYFVDKHQSSIDCPFVHVINNLKKTARHCLVDWLFGKVGSYPIFNIPNPNGKVLMLFGLSLCWWVETN
jgi:hypothetical protein